MIPSDQNSHQTVTFSDAFKAGVSRVDWYRPKFDNFASLIQFIHPKMGLAKDDLFGEIWVNFQLLQNPISEHMALSMVVYFKFLGQLNFIAMQT